MNSRTILFSLIQSFAIFGLMGCLKEDVPTFSITTNNIWAITDSSAICGGIILNDNGLNIISKGICWSNDPYFNDSLCQGITNEGTGPGVFVSYLTGLVDNTEYYACAYVTTSTGTIYGKTLYFKTNDKGAIKVTTAPISKLSMISAISGGYFIDNENIPSQSFGVIWDTTPNPTLTRNLGKTIEYTTPETDDFSIPDTSYFASPIKRLTNNTSYYVRAYVTNTKGCYYGNDVMFTTTSKGSTVTDIDGNVYQTITIGNQIWMTENLKTTKYNDGTDIIYDSIWNSSLSRPERACYCWPEFDINNKQVYGAIYTGYAAISGKLAPIGWHVPTNDEWQILKEYLGGYSVAGDKLKTVSGWYAAGNGIDEFGFSAVAAGYASSNRNYNCFKQNCFFWSQTDRDIIFGYAFNINYDDSRMEDFDRDKMNGFSVRCIKD